jgi:hypothetical protein
MPVRRRNDIMENLISYGFSLFELHKPWITILSISKKTKIKTSGLLVLDASQGGHHLVVGANVRTWV